MALVATNLTSGGNIASGSTTFVTASISPAANALILLWITNEHLAGTPAQVSSVTGCGLTWEKIDDVNYGSNCRLSLYRALGASPSAGTVTITYPTSEWSAIWSIEQITGVSTSGSNGSGAVLQSAQNSDGTAGSTLTVTLAALAGGSMDVAGFSFNVNDSGMTPGADWTTLASPQISRPLQILTAYNTTGDNTATASTSSAGSRGGIAVEVSSGGVLILVYDEDQYGDVPAPDMPLTYVIREAITTDEGMTVGLVPPVTVTDSITSDDAITVALQGVAVAVFEVFAPEDVLAAGSITVQPIVVAVTEDGTGSDVSIMSPVLAIVVSESAAPAEFVNAETLLELIVSETETLDDVVSMGSGSGFDVSDSLTTEDSVTLYLSVLAPFVWDDVLSEDAVNPASLLQIGVSDVSPPVEVLIAERVFTTDVLLEDLHFINDRVSRRSDR